MLDEFARKKETNKAREIYADERKRDKNKAEEV